MSYESEFCHLWQLFDDFWSEVNILYFECSNMNSNRYWTNSSSVGKNCGGSIWCQKCLSLKSVDLLGKLIPYYSITSINYLYLIPNMLCKYLLHRIILQNCSCMPIFVAQYFSLAKGYYFDTAGLPIGDKIFSEGAFFTLSFVTCFFGEGAFTYDIRCFAPFLT